MPRRRGDRSLPGPVGAGLQPERTSLAWHRTMGAMLTAGVMFLRWVPAYGWLAVLMTGLAATAAVVIGMNRARRYRLHTHGLAGRRIDADLTGVGLTAGGIVLIGALGLYAVLALPLR